jgi:hypothetical protein
MISVREAARLLSGDVIGRDHILCPGPGHGRADRSLAVWLTPDGEVRVHSHAGDDWRDCRDHVREILRLPDWRDRPRSAPRRATRQPPPALRHDDDQAVKIESARRTWTETVPIAGTPVEAYLRSRGLVELDGLDDVIRAHPALYRDGGRCGGMVALMRDALTDEPCGIHRTYIDADGRALLQKGRKDKRMLGRAAGAAIKLDAGEDITMGLHIGEGIETCLAARQLGYRPCWALGSVGAIERFPVLPDIEALTVLMENGDASTDAADAVCERYEVAGIEAWTIEPPAGDMNDYTRGTSL